MDEAGGVDDAPDAAAIRRALAECMTLDDIDDAMGWVAGTARRRRWHDPAAGGLPPADAELAGVPLWFRATISDRRARTSLPAPDDAPQAGPGPVPDPADPAEEADTADGDPTDEAPGDDSAGEPEERGSAAPGDRVDTGYALAAGQEVLAFVHGGWHPARVAARGRRTVVVDYQLGPGPLDDRRQRVTLDRIRLPDRDG